MFPVLVFRSQRKEEDLAKRHSEGKASEKEASYGCVKSQNRVEKYLRWERGP